MKLKHRKVEKEFEHRVNSSRATRVIKIKSKIEIMYLIKVHINNNKLK